jgi:hypothetical protein
MPKVGKQKKVSSEQSSVKDRGQRSEVRGQREEIPKVPKVRKQDDE